MKIHEIIRERRTAKGLTQEQLASRLGVSAPAVNKWEKAASYPDITLLPALARLLETDLNTLLSFREEPEEQEICNFVNEVAATAAGEGIGRAFQMAVQKIREYPSCGNLLLNTALTLDGLISMYGGTDCGEEMRNMPEEWYRRAAESGSLQAQFQAKAMLISKHMGRKEYEQAEKLLQELPDQISFNTFNKKQLQANLYSAQENYKKAAELIEGRLLSDISSVQAALYSLLEIAFKEGRLDDARQIARVAEQATDLFDLWEYGAYVADFEFAAAEEDAEKCLGALKKMLSAITKKWNPSASALYRHLPKKENGLDTGAMMLPGILHELMDPEHHEYDFLREYPKAREYLENYSSHTDDR